MIAALSLTIRPAFADQQYSMTGEDLYRVGSAGIVSRIEYVGQQMLTVQRQNGHTRYAAQAEYARSAADGSSHANARFVQELVPGGSFVDEVNDDPDFLTVLNQPFAVVLDAVTLRDLRNLHGAVPFSATSPLGGEAVLRGFLRPGTNGQIGGRPVVAVKFEAQGPMTAPMPARVKATMSGQMRMDGVAFYSLNSAMLLALDATLTIVARLRDGPETLPVRIVYRREIRASNRSLATPGAKPGPAKTPLPTPLATGGEKGSRATRSAGSRPNGFDGSRSAFRFRV
ncbi:MAG: hypothetical protein JOY69_03640 [Candidatus Eremiobacteraeota bacterium]|nr:hypothetical protein [Candidatus Eremiobacteraeota bacterium]